MAFRSATPTAQTGADRLPERRYLALHLPFWATDCLKRHDPALAGARNPLVLYEALKGTMRLAAVDPAAAAAGLMPGQTLADARALCPSLIAREIDHAFLASVFAEFADWHSNASPIVAVRTDEADYGDLMLDITGVAHLFGGEPAMLARLTGRLETLGFTVRGAVASTIGAAWALCRFAPGKVAGPPLRATSPEMSIPGLTALPYPPLGHPRQQGSGQALATLLQPGREMQEPHPALPSGNEGQPLESLLAPLPVAALRLAPDQSEALRQMGLKTIGHLYGRDRRALQARFGADPVKRLDQALGHAPERLTPRLPVPDRYADRRFGEPIGLIDDVLMTVRDLAAQLAARLEGEGLGAQTFHLLLYRVDHKLMQLSVNAARATRDPAHIARLFGNRMDRLVSDFDAGFGIEMVRLMASSVSEVRPAQIGAFATEDGAEDLDRLYDRMASRLGPQAILRTKFVNTHIPERAVVLEPVIARTPDDPLAAPDGRPRPLRLFPQPEAVAVMAEVPDGPPARMEWRRIAYRFVKASGPERIGVEWWQPGEGALTRDYYICEDESGRRFWVFREGLYASETGTPRWFLHGLFA